MDFINIAILTLLLVLAFVVLVKKNKKVTDYFLFAIILTIAGYIASDIWINDSLNHDSFVFHSLAGYLPFLPILFYGLLLTSRDHNLKKKWWWFTCFHLAYFLYILGDVYLWNEYTLLDIQTLYVDPPWPYHFFYKGLHVYMIIMLVWLLRRLQSYQANIQDYYSNLESVDLSWFRHFLYVYISVYSTSLMAMLLLNLGIIRNIEIAFIFIGVSILLSLLWMIYNGLKQFTLANFSETTLPVEETRKYATSSLSHSDAELLFNAIQNLFNTKHLYLNPDLRVQDLAKELGVTNHKISQALNEIAHKSFYDYVNDYRLDYFQKQLADPDKRKFTILALGMESGFNSKASMNRIFKKQFGETPRAYQVKMLSQ